MGKRLWVPRSVASAAYGAKKWVKKVAPTLIEAPGKKYGQPVGTWIDNLVQLRKVIILCPLCINKFNWKKRNYYPDNRFPWVQGKCDGNCQDWTAMGKAFYHESLLADPGGYLRAGQTLTPL